MHVDDVASAIDYLMSKGTCFITDPVITVDVRGAA